MSSILRALKKLESEPRHAEENRSLDNKFVPLADTVPQKSFSHIILLAVGGGTICGLVFLAGWWMFTEKNQPAAVAVSPQKIALQGPMSQQALHEPAQGLKSVSDTANSERPEGPPADTPAAQMTADLATDSEPMPAPALQIIEQEEIEEPAESAAIQTPETLSTETNEQVMLPAEKESPPPGSISEARIQTEKIDIPQLNDPEMKLQAVTWSKEPSKRIAVINNRILHEGEMVAGYFIATINQDDVVLSQEGKKWKLLFRIK